VPRVSSGHYFDPSPSARPRERTITLALPDRSLELVTGSGVFSPDRVDPGTKLLLLEGPEPRADLGPLLDLGCGYGPIAVTLATRCPDAQVWAIEVNERARELCRRNAERHGVSDRIHVCAPDEVDPAVSFGQIWSNPPIRVGKSVLHHLLGTWLGRMAAGGSAHLVVSKHLGADSLQSWLTEQGFEATRRRSRMGYRLLDVTRT
jgi:16S rRNA (guanine1207-N2)-methyltransferase